MGNLGKNSSSENHGLLSLDMTSSPIKTNKGFSTKSSGNPT